MVSLQSENSARKVHCLVGLEISKKIIYFFIVRLEIVYIFAAAKKYSKKVQRDFGMITTN
ncbi:hypothetical protein BTO04_06670 [Polaribacter sp. SA4-10]|nr:hypothetical protein BTO04_06670 [Polaribacter sp. SA4-10]